MPWWVCGSHSSHKPSPQRQAIWGLLVNSGKAPTLTEMLPSPSRNAILFIRALGCHGSTEATSNRLPNYPRAPWESTGSGVLSPTSGPPRDAAPWNKFHYRAKHHLWSPVCTVFAWLTLYVIELENAVCTVWLLITYYYYFLRGNKALFHCK